MPVICKKHYKNLVLSRQICEIVFNQEFSNLYEELLYIYKTYALNEPEKEAFQDAFYSLMAQDDCTQIIFNRALSF